MSRVSRSSVLVGLGLALTGSAAAQHAQPDHAAKPAAQETRPAAAPSKPTPAASAKPDAHAPAPAAAAPQAEAVKEAAEKEPVAKPKAAGPNVDELKSALARIDRQLAEDRRRTQQPEKKVPPPRVRLAWRSTLEWPVALGGTEDEVRLITLIWE